jgi:menaquinone-9 beta-reductase
MDAAPADTSWDAIVVGAGPAGSVAALVLARAGARVALVDRSAFPRQKACGDLIGPRGVQLLEELDLHVPVFGRGSDLVVIGPGGRRARLPAYPGRTYADHGIIVPRDVFDAALREAAIDAGATPLAGRIVGVDVSDGVVDRLIEHDGRSLRGRIVIGADGALSPIAHLTGLLDPGAALWGFAIRGYVEVEVPLPLLILQDIEPGRIFPGYGWLFPGAEGRANIGIGLALDRRRRPQRRLREELSRLAARLRATGDLRPDAAFGTVSGGWLRMGGKGSSVARGNVLLVGDAAGLVNPLQGEGIAHAMWSGRLAAEAVIAEEVGGSGVAVAEAYEASLRGRVDPFMSGATSLHIAMLRRPRLTSAAARLLTTPGVRRIAAGPWSLYMNGLADGAEPRAAAVAAKGVERVASRLP